MGFHPSDGARSRNSSDNFRAEGCKRIHRIQERIDEEAKAGIVPLVPVHLMQITQPGAHTNRASNPRRAACPCHAIP